MKIRIKSQVKHDGRTYEKDDEVTVSAELGMLFCRCGWASPLDDGVAVEVLAPPADVTLDVANGKIGHTADTIGNN